MPTTSPPTNADLVELADVLLDLAHGFDSRNPELRDVVPLTGTEVAVIREIHRRPRSSPSQVAEATGLQRSNVSAAIRTLVAGGLVVREEVAGNARSVALVPTELAEESVANLHAYWTRRLRQVPDELLREVVRATPALLDLAGRLNRS
ncbi:MarR family winged helix-turn-helix transcriptional regulator [Nocardioides campestrisoli]|uniref:MarR family winged helix-turn-helix transcriptional regulator n=1 Tax=Nocardioides campestrisoli TaxID=2736757 RepID=UPI0015E67D17|nr:MarR family winged helix-turn-helix transcriptional regulator [Nocardioides campestrisoli]